MTLRQTLLLIVITLLAGLGAAVFMHPRGANGVLDLIGFKSEQTNRALSTGGAADPVLDQRQAKANEIRKGNDAYDRGNFSGALTFYSIASITDDARLRDEALRGTQRAVLGWAVVEDTPDPDYGGRTADDRYIELLGRAETEQSEEAWLEVALFTSATSRGPELSRAVDALFETVRRGGPTETRLQNVLRGGIRKPTADSLRSAMRAIGLDDGAVGNGTMVLEHDDPDDTGTSGIGGTNRSPVRYRVPFGDFPKSFKPRLEEGARAEAEGMREALLAGPDGGEDRGAHRKEAIRLLTIARDVYNEGLEEHDPDSTELQSHYSKVIEALSLLRKSSVIGD